MKKYAFLYKFVSVIVFLHHNNIPTVSHFNIKKQSSKINPQPRKLKHIKPSFLSLCSLVESLPFELPEHPIQHLPEAGLQLKHIRDALRLVQSGHLGVSLPRNREAPPHAPTVIGQSYLCEDGVPGVLVFALLPGGGAHHGERDFTLVPG